MISYDISNTFLFDVNVILMGNRFRIFLITSTELFDISFLYGYKTNVP